jgi:ABC-type nitrate/sulfonate/bicarbonate transport system, ATPase component
MMDDGLLVMQGLNKYFQSVKGGKSILALDNISLTIREGEFVCILGSSGCGKSTLLNSIAGLLMPDSGRIACRGVVVDGPDRHRMLLFQDAALFPWLDVRQNVFYGLNLVEGLDLSYKRKRVDMMLELVGLSRFKHLRVHELSGGMRQRAALARSLAPDPDILLMDEPFSALDAMTREQLYADLQNIWQKTGKTIVMVTHNVREAACLGSRVLVMKAPGKVVADEPVSLPYPRNMNDTSLAAAAAHISSFLTEAGNGNGSRTCA